MDDQNFAIFTSQSNEASNLTVNCFEILVECKHK